MKIRKMKKGDQKLRRFISTHHDEQDSVYILESEKDYVAINKKHNTIYAIIGEIINATNDNDGQQMILYTDGKKVYAREVNEFHEKFTKLMEGE